MIIRLRLHWQYEQRHVATGSIIIRYAKRLLALVIYSCHCGIFHIRILAVSETRLRLSCGIYVFCCLEDIVLFIGTNSDVPNSMWNDCARAE